MMPNITPNEPTPLVNVQTECQKLISEAKPAFDRDDSWSNWGVYDLPVQNDGAPPGYVPTNSISGFGIQPALTYRPTNPYEISAAILAAEADHRRTIRAVGSGWGFSDAAVPQNLSGSMDYIIDSRAFASSLQSQLDSILVPTVDRSQYFFVEAGITLDALNILLDHESPRRALATLGGSSGQTLAGAISTGTHGGDWDRLPLADSVVALYVVGAGGGHYWLERDPNDFTSSRHIEFSPVDPNKLTDLYPCVGVRYDSDLFYSALVSMGSMGVIYAVLLKVVPQCSLLEWNREGTWEGLEEASVGIRNAGRTDLKGLLEGRWSGMLDFVERWIPFEEYLPNNRTSPKGRFLAVTINPIKADNGTHRCIVTNRFELRTQFESMGLTGGAFANLSATAIADQVQKDPKWDAFTDAIAANTALSFVFLGPLAGALSMPAAKGYPAGIVGYVEQMEDNGLVWAARDAIDYLLDVQFPQVALEELTGRFGSMVKTPVNFSWKEEPEVGAESEGAEDKYPQIDLAYKVMTRGGGDGGLKSFMASGIQILSLEAFNSLEVCFELIESILHQFNLFTAQSKYPVGYISLRVCGSSKAILAPQQEYFGPMVGAVEVGLLNTRSTLPMLTWLENEALAKKCTLHWGQSCAAMSRHILQDWYPGVQTWKNAQQLLGKKTFTNAFMRRFGLG